MAVAWAILLGGILVGFAGSSFGLGLDICEPFVFGTFGGWLELFALAFGLPFGGSAPVAFGACTLTVRDSPLPNFSSFHHFLTDGVPYRGARGHLPLHLSGQASVLRKFSLSAGGMYSTSIRLKAYSLHKAYKQEDGEIQLGSSGVTC